MDFVIFRCPVDLASREGSIPESAIGLFRLRLVFERRAKPCSCRRNLAPVDLEYARVPTDSDDLSVPVDTQQLALSLSALLAAFARLTLAARKREERLERGADVPDLESAVMPGRSEEVRRGRVRADRGDGRGVRRGQVERDDGRGFNRGVRERSCGR